MLRALFVVLLLTLAPPVFAKAHHTAVGSSIAPAGHGLPPDEANTPMLVRDLLGPKYCGLPFDQKAVHEVWRTNAKALGVSLASFTAEMKDRLRQFEVYWTGDLTEQCMDAVKYGKQMGYLPADYRWTPPTSSH